MLPIVAINLMITRSPALFLCVTHILLPYMEIYSIRWNQGFITSHILIKVNQNLVSLTLDLLATALSNTLSVSLSLFFPSLALRQELYILRRYYILL